jgi:hypothetical protein
VCLAELLLSQNLLSMHSVATVLNQLADPDRLTRLDVRGCVFEVKEQKVKGRQQKAQPQFDAAEQLRRLRTVAEQLRRLRNLRHVDMSERVGTNSSQALEPQLQWLAYCTALRTLHMPDRLGQVNDGDVAALAAQVAECTALTHLSAKRNEFDSEKWNLFAPCLAQLAALQRLRLGGVSVAAMGPQLAECTTLTALQLDFSHEPATEPKPDTLHELSKPATGFQQLGSSMARMANLADVLLAATVTTHAAWCAIAVGLVHATGQTSLRLNSGLQAAQAPALGSVLAACTSIRNLHLHRNTLHSGAAMTALGAGLVRLTALTALDLRAQPMYDEAIAELAPCFISLTRLQYLNMCEQRMTDGGVAILAGHLPALRGLTELVLNCMYGYGVSDVSGWPTRTVQCRVDALGPALGCLTDLADLMLDTNMCDGDSARALAPHLSKLTRLTSLLIACESKSAKEVLMASLSSATRLTSCDIDCMEEQDEEDEGE